VVSLRLVTPAVRKPQDALPVEFAIDYATSVLRAVQKGEFAFPSIVPTSFLSPV
jgi:hypothetical protein